MNKYEEMAERKTVNLQDIKRGKQFSLDWVDIDISSTGIEKPSITIDNLKCLLKNLDIEFKYNVINKEVQHNKVGTSITKVLSYVYSEARKNNFKISKDELYSYVNNIAEENKINPFLKLIRDNKNDKIGVFDNVFSCINIQEGESESNIKFYKKLFLKWCIGLVAIAHNSEVDINGYASSSKIQRELIPLEGVLVLKGGQGIRKTTFCRNLLPFDNLFKGGKSLNPDNKDSLIESTKYLLVELAELDSTLKSSQATLKQFFTETVDEYRAPFERVPEKYPRLTSFVGTINKDDFLKDETGSRRYWIIPVQGFDIEKLKEIDMVEFWGNMYNAYCCKAKHYLDTSELEQLSKLNGRCNFETDVTLALRESYLWEEPEERWIPQTLGQIQSTLGTGTLKQIKLEITKLGLEYKNRRINDKIKRSVLMPPLSRID